MKKFKDILEIYFDVKGSNRAAKYSTAESIYREKNGVYAFDDFRVFQALLNLHYAGDVPHNSAVKGYVRKVA